jgi:phosphatidate cytidylyltransferase
MVIFTILIRSLIMDRNVQETAALDLVIELAALVFVTYLGSYLIKIRSLPEGLLWIMVSIFPACMGDISAYAFGTLFGKNQLSPNLSPKKTLEGYFSGVAAAIFTGYVLGLITKNFTAEISITASMVIAGAVGVLSPLGDLSKSIFKRHFNLENTGNLIPGHGGILDRIDSWLWAAPIAYYLILFFFL